LQSTSKRKAGAPRSTGLQDKFGDVDGDVDSDLGLAEWGQERQLFIEPLVIVSRWEIEAGEGRR
jgi:hypothetical protein